MFSEIDMKLQLSWCFVDMKPFKIYLDAKKLSVLAFTYKALFQIEVKETK